MLPYVGGGEKTTFAGMIKYFKRGDYPGLSWALNIFIYILLRGVQREILPQTKKDVTTEAAIGVIYHKPRKADKHQKLEQAEADSPQDSLEVAWPSNTLILLLNFRPPEL